MSDKDVVYGVEVAVLLWARDLAGTKYGSSEWTMTHPNTNPRNGISTPRLDDGEYSGIAERVGAKLRKESGDRVGYLVYDTGHTCFRLKLNDPA